MRTNIYTYTHIFHVLRHSVHVVCLSEDSTHLNVTKVKTDIHDDEDECEDEEEKDNDSNKRVATAMSKKVKEEKEEEEEEEEESAILPCFP